MAKRICLTLQEKSKILEESQIGMSVTALSKKYGVAKSTICSIKNKKEKILKAVDLYATKRRTLKSTSYKLMENELYKWFLDRRKRKLHVSGSMIKEKALSLSQNVTFTASDGWLQRFKTRHGIRFLKVTGKKLSSQPKLVTSLKQKLLTIMQELNLCDQQIYSADETSLLCKVLHENMYISLPEGLKIPKQRLTFLCCANVTGEHKLTPLVIGKSRNQVSTELNNPLIYKSSSDCWMTGEILKSWFTENFVPEVKHFLKSQGLPPRAILLLDNVPSQLEKEEFKTSDGMIFVICMSPNVPPLIQPTEQNVLRTKLYYKKSYLSNIVAKQCKLGERLKILTIQDAIIHLVATWNKITPTIIKKCWQSILKCDEFNEDGLSLSEILKINDSKHNEVISDESTSNNSFKETDIWNEDCQDAQETQEYETVDVKEENIVEELNTNYVPHSDAIKASNLLIEWAKQNSLNLNHISTLQDIYENAVLLNLKTEND